MPAYAEQAGNRKSYGGWPALRDRPFSPDDDDQRRVQWAWKHWKSQDMLLASRDRQIEENLRMIAGRQWSVWSRLLGRFIDLNELLSQRERLFRQRPVFNHIFDWFLLTHARLTENPPIITFNPSTADRTDAELAEVVDVIFKSLWHDVGMIQVIDRAVSTLIPAGAVHLTSMVDPNQGEPIEYRGPALLEGDFGVGLVQRILPDVPYDVNGNPLARLTGPGDDDWEVTGKAYREYEGGIRVCTGNPIEYRGQWGNEIEWDDKRWHQRRHFLTPEEVFDIYGVECEPDVTGEEAQRMGELRRVLFGTGNFGSAEWAERSLTSGEKEGAEGFVDVLEMWHRPCNFPGMERGPGQPGGRLLTVGRKKVLRDGSRPADFRYTSPIRRWDFVDIPGRPSGSSPQEQMNALQRVYNRQWFQILEHGNKSANPIGIADKGTGLKEGMITNEPGLHVYINRRFATAAPPLEYVKPPQLGEVVYKALSFSRDELRDRGSMEGAQGRTPTRDASGELVKELRFNSDRYIGGTARRGTIVLSRMVEDWLAILPTIWEDEKVVTWAGEAHMVRTVLYRQHLFEQGSVNVTPDIESMLPEGRGERQARVRADWLAGAFGDPTSPQAIKHYLDLARYPHLGRAHRPGGIHREMAERENGHLVRGVAAQQVPIFEWQDHEVHLTVHEDFMSSPEYQELDPAVQYEFLVHRQLHLEAFEELQALAAQREARMATRTGKLQLAAEGELMAADEELTDPLPALPESAEAPEGRPPGAPAQPTASVA